MFCEIVCRFFDGSIRYRRRVNNLLPGLNKDPKKPKSKLLPGAKAVVLMICTTAVIRLLLS